MNKTCSILSCWPKNLQFTRFLRWNWEISESYLCKRIIRSLRLQRLNNASKYFVSKMVGRNFSGQKRLLKAVTIIWCVFTWIKKTKSSSFQCRAICCPCIGYRPPYYRGLTLPGQVGKSHQQIVRFLRQSPRSPLHSKKYWFNLEQGLRKLARKNVPFSTPWIFFQFLSMFWGSKMTLEHSNRNKSWYDTVFLFLSKTRADSVKATLLLRALLRFLHIPQPDDRSTYNTSWC